MIHIDRQQLQQLPASMSYSIRPYASVSACFPLSVSPRLLHLVQQGLHQGLHLVQQGLNQELMIYIDRQLLELLHCLACLRLPTFVSSIAV